MAKGLGKADRERIERIRQVFVNIVEDNGFAKDSGSDSLSSDGRSITAALLTVAFFAPIERRKD